MGTYDELIPQLQAQIQPIEPQDTMAEAGRKALLDDLIKMLGHEAGSRAGEDPEEVHDMRVATRRMRSTLRLLESYYKPKAIQPYLEELRRLAHALGEVRDLDVMIATVRAYQETVSADESALLQPVCDQLVDQQTKARRVLIRILDKRGYRRFVEDYSGFVTKAGKGAYAVDLDDIHPFQVRHLLPELVYQHLAAVRAYEDVIADADVPTLHALRIEFKRLRYAVSIFEAVLGSTIEEFVAELKSIQDHLGNIADIRAAKDRLKEIGATLDPTAQAESCAALQRYIDTLDSRQKQLRDEFPGTWKHFSTKTVQRQLATALAGL